MEERFMNGDEALGEALVRAGCRFYFSYPITPASELLEYLSWRMPDVGGVFLQAESEIAAINMVHGAAATGKRVAIGSSGPGISLMQEGISYISSSELPCLIINMSRGGPGLGPITSSQGDYFQATRGGGHGDYRTVVLAPSTGQEMVDMVSPAFELAEKYRIAVVILADAMLGEAFEVVKFPPPIEELPPTPVWALTGAANRPRNLLPEGFGKRSYEELNLGLGATYQRISQQERRSELWGDSIDDLLIVAFGTTARVCKSVVREASQEGIRVGLFRPITLYPFPCEELKEAAQKTKKLLVVEMSLGQMIDDVRLAVANQKDIEFYGRVGGIVPTKKEIVAYVHKVIK